MDLPGQLIFSNASWLPYVLGSLVFFVLLLLWSYRGSGLSWPRTLMFVSLKVAAALLLSLALLEPQWTEQKPEPGANFIAIVGDNSQSMSIMDPGLGRSRGDELTALLITEPGAWRDELDSMFQVRRYGMDARLHGLKDFSELTYDGSASNIGGALVQIASRFKQQPLAGVLLLSDGNTTGDMDLSALDFSGLPPVYPVVIGSDQSSPDVSIRQISVTQTAFEDAPVTLRADLHASGYAGKDIAVDLYEVSFDSEDGVAPSVTEMEPMESVLLTVSDDEDDLNVRFQFNPSKPGISFYRLETRVISDPLAVGEPAKEATQANNQRMVVVQRDANPHRLLYVSGRPNWEYKFLNRSLAEDDQVQLVGLIRIARKAPKFEFKGRQGETSNPLYRGFDRKDEFTEQMDQAVFTRLNIRDETELVGGFPSRAEDLFGYTAILLDDLESDFFTQDQMSLIQRFVAERGGGLMMLGGYESLNRGDYDQTPIGRMLPIYLDGDGDLEGIERVSLELTREGWLQPWIRLRSTEALERERLASMPEFKVVNLAKEIKPGASVLMEAKDRLTGESYPALVSQRFGAGRTMTMAVGDLWRWQMHDQTQSGDLGKAWRQMIRGLIADVPKQTHVDLNRIMIDAGPAMDIEVSVRNDEFLPVDQADVRLTVTHLKTPQTAEESADNSDNSSDTNASTPASRSIELSAEPGLKEPGWYQAQYVPREEGAYHLAVEIAGPEGQILAREESGWTNDPNADEFQSLIPHRAWLQSLADQTGGRVLAKSELDDWARGLQFESAPVMQAVTNPIWQTPYLFLLAICLLLTEWFLRRKGGLA